MLHLLSEGYAMEVRDADRARRVGGMITKPSDLQVRTVLGMAIPWKFEIHPMSSAWLRRHAGSMMSLMSSTRRGGTGDVRFWSSVVMLTGIDTQHACTECGIAHPSADTAWVFAQVDQLS